MYQEQENYRQYHEQLIMLQEDAYSRGIMNAESIIYSEEIEAHIDELQRKYGEEFFMLKREIELEDALSQNDEQLKSLRYALLSLEN